MKVKELKKALEELDPNLEIVLSSNGDNSFGILYPPQRGFYYLDGEIYIKEDKPKKAKKVIVLFPR